MRTYYARFIDVIILHANCDFIYSNWTIIIQKERNVEEAFKDKFSSIISKLQIEKHLRLKNTLSKPNKYLDPRWVEFLKLSTLRCFSKSKILF